MTICLSCGALNDGKEWKFCGYCGVVNDPAAILRKRLSGLHEKRENGQNETKPIEPKPNELKKSESKQSEQNEKIGNISPREQEEIKRVMMESEKLQKLKKEASDRVLKQAIHEEKSEPQNEPPLSEPKKPETSESLGDQSSSESESEFSSRKSSRRNSQEEKEWVECISEKGDVFYLNEKTGELRRLKASEVQTLTSAYRKTTELRVPLDKMWGSLVPKDPALSMLTHTLIADFCSIGVDKQCDVILDNDPAFSRKHCTIFKHQKTGEVFIKDENSTNGTFVNGKKLGRGEIRKLKTNDEISFAVPQHYRTFIFEEFCPKDFKSKPTLKQFLRKKAGVIKTNSLRGFSKAKSFVKN